MLDWAPAFFKSMSPPFKNKSPLALMSPVTCNVFVGVVVPIPTFPSKNPRPNEPVEVDEPLMFPLAVMWPPIIMFEVDEPLMFSPNVMFRIEISASVPVPPTAPSGPICPWGPTAVTLINFVLPVVILTVLWVVGFVIDNCFLSSLIVIYLWIWFWINGWHLNLLNNYHQ